MAKKSEQQGVNQNADAAPSSSTSVEVPETTGELAVKKGEKDSVSDSGMVWVTSVTRKNKTIVAVSGTPITFDSAGKAEVSKMDALYLESCSGFVIEQ